MAQTGSTQVTLENIPAASLSNTGLTPLAPTPDGLACTPVHAPGFQGTTHQLQKFWGL